MSTYECVRVCVCVCVRARVCVCVCGPLENVFRPYILLRRSRTIDGIFLSEPCSHLQAWTLFQPVR